MPGASKAGAKRETVAELAEYFSNSSAAVLTEYRGLTVAQVSELRRSLGTGTTYAVVKNTLTKIAAEKAGVRGLDALLTGPTAVAFVQGDPVEAAKALRAFGKDNPLLIVKGGVLNGNPLTAAEIGKLADLESREVLLSKLAGVLNATTAKAAALFQAPLAQAARVAGALLAKAEADPSILGGGAGTPAPAEATAAAPAEAGAATGHEATGITGSDVETGETGAEQAPEAVATATEGSVTLTVDEAVSVEIGEPAPASNADAPAEADTEHGAGVVSDETA